MENARPLTRAEVKMRDNMTPIYVASGSDLSAADERGAARTEAPFERMLETLVATQP